MTCNEGDTTMRMTFYGITKHIVSYCETRAKQCRNASTDAPSEYERGRQYGRSEAFESVGAAIRENLAHEAWLLLFKDNSDEPRADIDEPLTKTILRRWMQAKNGAEKDRVRGEIGMAMNEMICEALPWEHELRMAVMRLLDELHAVAFGQTLIPHWDITKRHNEGADAGGPSHAPLVGLAGHIAAMLYVRGAMRGQMLAEHLGGVVHATRVDDAMNAKRIQVRNDGSMTGYIAPIDKRSVKCRICGVDAGEPCVQPKTVANE